MISSLRRKAEVLLAPLLIGAFALLLYFKPQHSRELSSLGEIRAKAEKGDARSQYRLGDIYFDGFIFLNGDTVPQDHAEALKWFQQAAENCDSKAQFCIGFMYSEGMEILQDNALALKWFQKAAEKGLAPAQFRVGLSFDNALGVPQDYAEALKWYRRAADQEYPRAQYILGQMHTQGRGVRKDMAVAIQWYLKAANQGHAEAQFELGLIHLNGTAVPQDFATAYMWLNLAAGGKRNTTDDQQKFSTVRDDVLKKLTSAQIAESQQLARAFQPHPAKIWLLRGE